MTERVELKPCPFCGGDAEIHEGSTYGWYVNCCVDMGGFSDAWGSEYNGSFDSRDEAISAWNRRAEG